MYVADLFDDKQKGADGKACWTGYRYTGTKNGKDRCVKITETSASEAVQSAILRRIVQQHPSVLRTYGPEACMSAAAQVADEVGDVEEIGSSDVSAYTQRAIELCSDYRGM
jgi:hypothetical protein